MDTDWFGVDSEGHVALFSTGENGILPEIAATEIGMPDIIDLIVQEQQIRCDLGDVLARQPDITMLNLEQVCNKLKEADLGKPRGQSTDAKGKLTSRSFCVETMDNGGELRVWVQQDELTKRRTAPLWDCLVVCADASIAAPLVPPGERGRGQARHMLCTSETDFDLLRIGEITVEELFKLFQEGVFSRGWTLPHIRFRRFGFFEYDCDDYCDNRYLIEAEPLNPVKADQLPLRVQEQIGSAFFPDISFARQDEIWPRRYYRCRTWRAEL